MASATSALLTRRCGRCGGSGKYSFNLMDHDRCYGCGGTGRVLVTPRGQKKIVPTCTDYQKALTGDLLKHGPVLYHVEEIRWVRLQYMTAKGWINQQLTLTRLVDGKTVQMKRLYEKVTLLEQLPNGGTRETREMIKPSEEMIGQLAEV